jgi:hypothetical protein
MSAVSMHIVDDSAVRVEGQLVAGLRQFIYYVLQDNYKRIRSSSSRLMSSRRGSYSCVVRRSENGDRRKPLIFLVVQCGYRTFSSES